MKFEYWRIFVQVKQEVLRETLAALVLLTVDTLKLASSSGGSAQTERSLILKCNELDYVIVNVSIRLRLTSPTAFVRIWMILSWGVATTLCPLISMMRCPTRIPPLSAIPPRIRLQICNPRTENCMFIVQNSLLVPSATDLLIQTR